MGARKDMSLAFERLVAPARARRTTTSGEESEGRLNVAVVFTSGDATLAALRKAGALADRLNGRITLLVPQIVPYPLPLESPPVLLDFSERRLRQLARESAVETTVRIYLCRDRIATLKAVLAPRSLVVIGGRRRLWWRTREQSLARQLRHAGHEVIFTETE